MEAARVSAVELVSGGGEEGPEDYMREKRIKDGTSKNTMGITLPERPWRIF